MQDLTTLLLQVAVICAVARAVGWLFKTLQQPRVVGEIVAGLLLGPSFFGWIAPAISAFVFPPESLGPLNTLSQLGLMLFMFQVGMELNLTDVLRFGRVVVVISYAGIFIPFVMGAGLALFLSERLSSPSVSLSSFALFMGIAMSITAFPVLARILAEKGLLQTKIGSIALASAAIDNLTSWCLLALLSIKVVSSSPSSLLFKLAGLAWYAMLMLGVRHFLSSRAGKMRWFSLDRLAPALLFMLASALVTHWLGIHAFFGAFFAGLVLPKHQGPLSAALKKLEPVTTVVLLPLFFAFIGLRTRVLLINSADLWLYCGLIILIAVSGKLLGCGISGRIMGMNGHEALAIGILMNTRGVVELVILNLGLNLNIISPALFSMMVMVAQSAISSSVALWKRQRKRFGNMGSSCSRRVTAITFVEALLDPKGPNEACSPRLAATEGCLALRSDGTEPSH